MKKINQFFKKPFLAILAVLGFVNFADAQCAAGQAEVFIDVITDAYGYEVYWELVPQGVGCGTPATIFAGGNTAVSCAGGGLQGQTPGGYANSTTTTEPQTPTGFCLTIGATYQIIAVDDWGDGGTCFASTTQGFNFCMPAGSANDTFTFTVINPITEDLAVDNHIGAEYTITPLSQVQAMNLDAQVSNNGTSTANDAILMANVYLGAALQQTLSSAPTTVNAGASAPISAGVYLPTVAGNYTVEYVVSSVLLNDGNPTNDTLYYQFTIDDNYYARDGGTAFGALGGGAGTAVILGQNYVVTTTCQIDSVLFGLNSNGGAIGDTVEVVIMSTVGGVPTTVIGGSDAHIITAADTLGNINVIRVADVSGNQILTLTPGTYFIGVSETSTGENMGLIRANDIFTPGTVYASLAGGAFAEITTFSATFIHSFIIRPFVSVGCFTSPTPMASVTSNYNGADVSCNGSSDGAAGAMPVWGAPPYSYMWDITTGAQATETATGLGAGMYTVTITDNASCVIYDTVMVTEPTPVSSTTDTVMNVMCNGGMDGSIMITSAGGTAPYTFMWSNSEITEDVSGLMAGPYTVTISDVNGCTMTATETVMEPTALVAAAVDNANGSATASGTGGTAAYMFMWDATAASQTTATATGLTGGTYGVTVTDANGCMDSTTVTVVGVAVNMIDGVNALNMFPNPTASNVFVNLDLTAAQDVTIRVANVTGQVVLENNLGTVETTRVELNTSELPTGIYMVHFNIGNETMTRKLVVNRQ